MKNVTKKQEEMVNKILAESEGAQIGSLILSNPTSDSDTER